MSTRWPSFAADEPTVSPASQLAVTGDATRVLKIGHSSLAKALASRDAGVMKSFRAVRQALRAVGAPPRRESLVPAQPEGSVRR